MLARQQVIVDHFPQQCMPEGVARFIRGQYGSINRLPQLSLQLSIRGVGRSREQSMINPGAGHCSQLQSLLGPVRKAQDPYVQGIPKGVWHVDTAASG